VKMETARSIETSYPTTS